MDEAITPPPWALLEPPLKLVVVADDAPALNLNVVAEGVETKEQLDFLKKVDCDVVQGFFLGRPIPADKLEALLKESKKDLH